MRSWRPAGCGSGVLETRRGVRPFAGRSASQPPSRAAASPAGPQAWFRSGKSPSQPVPSPLRPEERGAQPTKALSKPGQHARMSHNAPKGSSCARVSYNALKGWVERRDACSPLFSRCAFAHVVCQSAVAAINSARPASDGSAVGVRRILRSSVVAAGTAPRSARCLSGP